MSRLVLVVLLALLGWTPAALAGAEEELQAGLVAFAQGELDAALGHFRTARELDPRLVDAHYQEGVVLVELGRLPEATEAFRRALSLDPGHLQSGVDLAAVLARLGDAAAVADALVPVTGDGAGEAGRDSPATGGAPSGGGAAAAEAPMLALGLRLDLGYDSHVLLGPDDAVVGLAAAGGRLALRSGLVLRPYAGRDHRVRVHVRLRRVQHLGAEADDLNHLAVEAGGRYGLCFALAGTALEVSLAYDAHLVLADGGPALADLDGESGFHLQAERHDLVAGIARLEDGRPRTWIRSRSRLQSYAGRLDEYNHLTHDHCLAHVFALAARSVDLELGACLRWTSQARSREQEVIAPRGRVGLDVRLLDELAASLALGYENEEHPRSRHGRVDDVLTVELGARWDLTETWRLHLGWWHTENWSTLNEFEFRRDEVRVGIELRL